MTDPDLKPQLVALITSGVYGLFGAIVQYFWYNTKYKRAFKFSSLVLNALLGFYIGTALYSFIPNSLQNQKGGILLVSGFLVWHILEFIEERGFDFIKRKLGLDDDED